MTVIQSARSAFWRRVIRSTASIAFVFLIAGCAAGVVQHAFSFDASDAPGIQILDYRYGDSRQPSARPEPSLFALGRVEQAVNIIGEIRRPDSLYVRWRDVHSGTTYEDTVDLSRVLPRDITRHRIHFSASGSRLFVYLIIPQRRAPGDPPIGPPLPAMYQYLKVIVLAVDQGREVTPDSATTSSTAGAPSPAPVGDAASHLGSGREERASLRERNREDHWRLDTELLNEIAMKSLNSRRFDLPDPYEKRARWVEAQAAWYPIADLVQQLVDFRESRMRDDEAAFLRLVELGRRGDTGARCLAAAIYKHFPSEVTARWGVRYETVALEALKDTSGHPVCATVQAGAYLRGDVPAYDRAPAKAKPALVASAVAGLYTNQMFLAGTHLAGSTRFDAREVALKLCWQRVADQQPPFAAFKTTCEAYRLGVGSDLEGKPLSVPAETQTIAARWCAPTLNVTARECALGEIAE